VDKGIPDTIQYHYALPYIWTNLAYKLMLTKKAAASLDFAILSSGVGKYSTCSQFLTWYVSNQLPTNLCMFTWNMLYFFSCQWCDFLESQMHLLACPHSAQYIQTCLGGFNKLMMTWQNPFSVYSIFSETILIIVLLMPFQVMSHCFATRGSNLWLVHPAICQ